MNVRQGLSPDNPVQAPTFPKYSSLFVTQLADQTTPDWQGRGFDFQPKAQKICNILLLNPVESEKPKIVKFENFHHLRKKNLVKWNFTSDIRVYVPLFQIRKTFSRLLTSLKNVFLDS